MNITDIAHFMSLRTIAPKPRPAGRSQSAMAPPVRKAVSPATFTHLRPVAIRTPVTEPKQDGKTFALNLLGAVGKERGERFDATTFEAGPEQRSVFATGEAITAAAKKAGLVQ